MEHRKLLDALREMSDERRRQKATEAADSSDKDKGMQAAADALRHHLHPHQDED